MVLPGTSKGDYFKITDPENKALPQRFHSKKEAINVRFYALKNMYIAKRLRFGGD